MHTPMSTPTPDPGPLTPAIDPRRIDVAEASSLVNAGQAVLLDARDPRLFDNAHPRGAVSLPAALLEGSQDVEAIQAAVGHPGLLLFYCA